MCVLFLSERRLQLSRVEESIRKQGFDVQIENDVNEALKYVQSEETNLAILPANDCCASVIRQVRRSSSVPIMVISDKSDARQRAELYKCGIDDYIESDVSIEEIEFRVHALMRRCHWSVGNPSSCVSQSQSHVLKVDELTLDSKTYEASLADKAMVLTPVQFRLLWTMASHKNKVLSKPYLYRVLFDREYSSHDRGVDIHISRVRKKLNLAGGAAQRLYTVHGKGYCFS